jgi:hypothetical protein
MRRALLLAVLLSVILPLGVRAAGDDYIGLFKNVSGDLKVIRDKADIVPAAGTRIQRSDIVVSGANSTAGIVFEDGTLLTVGPSSEVSIRRYAFQPEVGKFDFALFLRKGSAIYASGKLGKLSPESVSLQTPKATVGVRGTRFILKAD